MYPCDKDISLDSQISKNSTNNGVTEDSGLRKNLQDDAIASCSNNFSIPKADALFDSEINDTTVSSVLEVADSLSNVQLDDNSEKSEIHSISKTNPKINFIQYESELQMPMIMKIIQKDLSEPYSIYTYRYFIHNWPKLCFLVSFLNVQLNTNESRSPRLQRVFSIYYYSVHHK